MSKLIVFVFVTMLFHGIGCIDTIKHNRVLVSGNKTRARFQSDGSLRHFWKSTGFWFVYLMF
jgi:muconolactone delta-isomerase